MMKSLAAGLLSAALCAALSLPAHAITILFASGEDTGFNAIVGASGAAQGVSSSYLVRSGYARSNTAVAVFNSTNVADPPASRLQTPTFSAVSTLWIHSQIDMANSNANTSGQQGLIVRSPDGVSRIVMRQTGTSGQLKVSKRNAAGTITDLATASSNINTATLTSLDIEIIYGCTSGDQVNVWYNGSSVIAFTGASICTDSATTLNQVEFAGFNGGGGGSVTNGGTSWTEVIISDSDTRGMALWTLAPTAAGNTQSWTPNTVADINPSVINDANFVATGSSSSLSEWTTPTTPPSGTWGVLGIVQEARVLRGTTGPQNFDFLARTKDGTDHLFGYSSTLSTSFGNFGNQIWTTNPHTSASWVITDVASGFNLGIESLP